MSLKSAAGKIYAKLLVDKLRKTVSEPLLWQHKTRTDLVAQAQNTVFGKAHNFTEISTYEDFKKHVPIRDYEGMRSYIDQVVAGAENITWPGRPAYFCKTSGTTSGAKYIPISKESVRHHVDAAKLALLCYVDETGKSDFINGKMIFLQGSPELTDLNGVPLGRLSGITAHWVPGYLQKNRLPSWETNRIEDWETKVDAIVDETTAEDMRLISGIPSWVQMYFERLIEKSDKKTVAEIFPNFSLFVHGGVNFQPYEAIFKRLIGKEIPSVETYPASEGFIAFQDSQTEEGLLLNVNAGIFFEFIPVSEFHDENPSRIMLDEVELGVNYVLILSTNAGLWGYNIGDTVKFVNDNPYRIVVTGRIKHFTSAFGEHVIAEEVESSLKEIMPLFDVEVREFHLAPQIAPKAGLPYHEWFIEFDSPPANMDAFRLKLDAVLQSKNPYYKDLITGSVLKPLVVTSVPKDGFKNMMKAKGKLGGQNKIPRLANDRDLADLLIIE
tara:strand:- start:12833 stop:14323 length:1491 start_codon:yes stop_codon:yes gene_type:complete